MADRSETGTSGRKKKPEDMFCAEEKHRTAGRKDGRCQVGMKEKKNRGIKIIEAVEVIRQ